MVSTFLGRLVHYHLDLCLYVVECKTLLFLLCNFLLFCGFFFCFVHFWLSSLLLGTCLSPPRAVFARISEEDETQNFYTIGVTVRYICRRGFENITDQLPTSTCRDNLTWSEVPELCQSECPASFHFL